MFLIFFTTHSFAKSNEYYKTNHYSYFDSNVIVSVKKVFEQEVQSAFFDLISAIVNQLEFEISQKRKELWLKDL